MTVTATTTASLVPTVRAYAPASKVREWALANDIPVGTRGKFSPELISAYNAKNGLKYVPGKHVETVTVTGRDAKGKKVTRKVNVNAAREALAAQGVTVGKRGRVSYALLAQAVGLTPIVEKSGPTMTFRGKVTLVSEVRDALIAQGAEVGLRGRIPAALTA
jgi:hypothetical protein